MASGKYVKNIDSVQNDEIGFLLVFVFNLPNWNGFFSFHGQIKSS
jgi:hypothetical protein